MAHLRPGKFQGQGRGLPRRQLAATLTPGGDKVPRLPDPPVVDRASHASRSPADLAELATLGFAAGDR